MTRDTIAVGRQGMIVGVAGKPCSVNRMYGRGRRGFAFLTAEAAAWELAVVTDVRMQVDCQKFRAFWEQSGKPQLAVEITLYGVRGDADNYAKSTLDGLKQALGIDDRHFSPVTVRHGARTRANGKLQPPGARIEVTQEPGWEPGWEPGREPGQKLHAPGSLRARELLDDEVVERLAPPLTSVRVFDASAYGAVVVMFPPSELSDHPQNSEWGAFLPLAQARELRDALNALQLEEPATAAK